MTRILAAAVIAMLHASQAPNQTADTVKRQLIGNWKLVKYELFDANGAARPGRYDVGRIAYFETGEMTAHLMHAGDEHAYFAYFGPFTVDVQKETVTHHVVGSSNQSWLGSDQVRFYRFSPDGSQLTLSVKSGERTTQVLTWIRMK